MFVFDHIKFQIFVLYFFVFAGQIDQGRGVGTLPMAHEQIAHMFQ